MYFVGASWWTLFCAGIILVLAFWFAERRESVERKRRERGRIRSGGQPGSPDARRTASEYARSRDDLAQATGAKGLVAPGASSPDYLAALRRIHGRKP